MEHTSAFQEFQESDRDGNGFISPKEVRRSLRMSFTGEEMVDAFGGFDHDGNGFISDAELSLVVKKMVHMADTGGNELITFEEFLKNRGG